MASVGERIRQERESRNTTLDDMSVATGIGQSYLESLERGEYHELPGPAFGKLYIRAYAEVLGFDPQPWIDDYDREHRLLRGASADPGRPAPPGSRPMAAAIARWRESKMAAGTEETDVEPEPVVEDPPSELIAAPEPRQEPEAEPAPKRARTMPPPEAVRVARRRILVPFLLVIALSLVVGFIIRGTSRTETERPAAAAPRPVKTAPATAAPTTAPPAPPPPVVVEPRKTVAASAPAAAPPATTPVPSADLTVTEFGVGRRIVNSRLEGAADHFTEGDRVSFSTRVVGGRRGNVIRHVWIYEGRAQQSIPLRLGASDYRTYTNKSVGKAGAWAVEARDDRGRVLARTEFTVEPRSR